MTDGTNPRSTGPGADPPVVERLGGIDDVEALEPAFDPLVGQGDTAVGNHQGVVVPIQVGFQVVVDGGVGPHDQRPFGLQMPCHFATKGTKTPIFTSRDEAEPHPCLWA